MVAQKRPHQTHSSVPFIHHPSLFLQHLYIFSLSNISLYPFWKMGIEHLMTEVTYQHIKTILNVPTKIYQSNPGLGIFYIFNLINSIVQKQCQCK